jgi:hypothetical protein
MYKSRLQNMRGSVIKTTAIAKQAAVFFKLRPDAGGHSIYGVDYK